MTRLQALELYVKNNKAGNEMVRRFMLWNPKLTIRQNADIFKVHYGVVRGWAIKCGLKYKNDTIGKPREFKKQKRRYYRSTSQILNHHIFD